ncbi:MAG: Plug domain-containing protein [Sediminibacterium sp.]
MKRDFLFLFITFLALFATHISFGQQIDSAMAIYDDQFPKEKIHIHFDRSIYNKAETIWYKLYLLAPAEPGAMMSKNVYVEWYDAAGKMIRQTVSPLYQSTAKGAFEIPTDYAGSFLHVKAFTQWMLNDDPAFSYERDIAINNVPAKRNRKPVIAQTKVEAFPEGGFLIQGLLSKVAFKATNQFGIPVRIKGSLVTDKNKVIDSLSVQHDGMGIFSVIPQPEVSYKLNWTDENGVHGTTPIAVTKTEGATIAVTTTNEKALVLIERTNNVTDDFKQLNLLVHMNQKLFYKVKIRVTEKTKINAEIPIDELPTGILQFSLFTADWVPVAERIIFVNNHLHEFNAKLTTPLVDLNKRAKNIIDIFVPDTAFANMSIAVTDAAITTENKHTIYSDLLLSDDIKGTIYNPAYYLKSDADSVTAHLDLVMLTNGWRRFDWDKIKSGMMPRLAYPRENDYLKLTGKVYGAKSVTSGIPLQLNFILAAKDSSRQFLFLPVAKDGSFEQRGLFFYDTVKVFYGFNGNKGLASVTEVHIENGLLRQTPKNIVYPEKDVQANWNDSLARLKMNYFFDEEEKRKKRLASTTLQEVVVKSKVKNPLQLLEEKYATGLFSGGDGYSFDLTDDKSATGYMDILSYLQGKVAGLQISGSGSQTSLNWRGGAPDLYLDEFKSNIDLVQSIPVSNIAFIKVFRPPFFGSGGGGGGGAIAIYTRKGGDRKPSANTPGLESTILGGYSRFKEFYNPSYEKPNNESTETDTRTTLYWNPYVLTNKKNPHIKLEFYNNDISKKLQIVLEGINGDGKLTRVIKSLE